MNPKIELSPRVVLGVKRGYSAEVNGTTYNVVKNPAGGWKVIECSDAGARHLPSVRTLEDAKAAIASNEGF